MKDAKDQQFSFTYSIMTKNDVETAWTMRMEHYMLTGKEKIHYGAIDLSLSIIVGLTCILSCLMRRGLNADFLTYFKNRVSSNKRRQERASRLPQEDEAGLTNRNKNLKDPEDVAWKKVHGDVMR